MKITNFFSEKIKEIIDENKKVISNPIFVITDASYLLKDSFFSAFIDDKDTFDIEKDKSVFDRKWFTDIFTKLNLEQEFHLLSFAQFSYLISYIDPSFFIDRIVIIKDNLRQLFPLKEEEFCDKSDGSSMEARPEKMPLHHAEQFKINNRYYFSIKYPAVNFKTVELFNDRRTLKKSMKENSDIIIDVTSDQNAIDIFFNNCIKEEIFNKNVLIQFHKKHPFNEELLENIEKLNFVLNNLGGSLFLLDESPVPKSYQVKNLTNDYLSKFWGENASFRNLRVYENPDFNNEIVEISQGLIVDIIIDEYENARNHKPFRDLFLTAPTGSGKSLLFQLPAFYVSDKGDVTIVVSPLIALMKDQVLAIINDRKFDKVAYINSELSLIDREKIIDNCKTGEIDILYLSPELLLSYNVSHFIGERNLGLLIVDEAHLITTWGRDFRVDYWFLGNHIRKIRKYGNHKFPMVAVTATAVYGGANDMIFDSVDSLLMLNPHIFVGEVKRNDIEFVINNYENFESNYEKNKLEQTTRFIQQVNDLGLKTLVYAPYTKHVRQLLDFLRKDHPDIATGYYGTLDSTNKELSFRSFKSGKYNVMISTKAFGMGIDISDIQVVYHHAPSGLLPDYIQEIGRVARDEEIKGYAVLNYSSKDQHFSKILHGMSALRQYQIREVLSKIFKSYLKNKKSRNLLLSVDDFGYIFENAIDLDQKVLTALMMIEKDYLAKFRFNVLIARPKKLFVKVFAKVTQNDLITLKKYFSNSIKVIVDLEYGSSIVELDLDKIWYKHYPQKSFPVLKRDFYMGNLLKDYAIELIPQIKISFKRTVEYSKINALFHYLFKILQNIFSDFQGGYFTLDEFQKELNVHFKDKVKSDKIAKFILSTYSGRLLSPGVIEDNAFLQKRRNFKGYKYRVFNNRYLANFASLLKRLNNLFGKSKKPIIDRFLTNRESNAVNYVRLGYLLEMTETGTFEITGGENPMIFVRINDPNRIEKDSKNKGYRNTLLSKTLERYYLSNQIFDHFFLRGFDNKDRWNFIEDYFLGADVDILLEKYKGRDTNKTDIIKYLENNAVVVKKSKKEEAFKDNYIHHFPPNPDTYYTQDNILTIETEKGIKTLKVSKWLTEDPVSFDKIKRMHNLKVDKTVFQILVSKLRNYHPEYFKDVLGLNTRIEFKGYERKIKASIPYKDDPVNFYKWWIKNRDKVKMTFKEKLVLFNRINLLKPNILKREDKNLLEP